MFRKIVRKFEDASNISFAEYELNESTAAAVKDVRCVPTFHVYHDGECVFDKSGVNNVKTLDTFLQNLP
jgi:hypothetical protein